MFAEHLHEPEEPNLIRSIDGHEDWEKSLSASICFSEVEVFISGLLSSLVPLVFYNRHIRDTMAWFCKYCFYHYILAYFEKRKKEKRKKEMSNGRSFCRQSWLFLCVSQVGTMTEL